MSDGFHERLDDSHEVKLPSERSFAITFAVVFALIGAFPLLHGGSVRLWALAVAAVFLAAGFLAPASLRRLNRLWMRFGLLLHRIVNPVMLGLMFGLIVVPMGLAVRLIKGPLLDRKPDPKAASYWILRDPPGPAPDSIRNQF
ncbi:SxtJ family membrane protein [Hansschlegelia sp. KR7-227]|uniref:SxtJ family membrane protein n=1 Tax=Hansschlegelia sp. KR7-227 TaxID=3400914 RepID=UPI003C082443